MKNEIIKKTFIYVVVIGVVSFLQPNYLSANKKEEVKEGKITETDKRAQLRAFYTAPPVIPHEVTNRGQKECLYCHQDVMKVEGRISVKTPHPQMYNCQQCHVQGNIDKPMMKIENYFQGLQEPKKGAKAHEFAPTTIPHRTFMRENCLSCHGPDNPDENMRTPHPERSNCRQCHVTQSDVEFTVTPKDQKESE